MKSFIVRHSAKALLFLTALASLCLLFADIKLKTLKQKSKEIVQQVYSIEQDEPEVNLDCSALQDLLSWYDYFPEEILLIRNWSLLQVRADTQTNCGVSDRQVLDLLSSVESLFIRKGYARDIMASYEALGHPRMAAGVLKKSFSQQRAPAKEVLEAVRLWLQEGMDPKHILSADFPGIYYWSRLFREDWPALAHQHRASITQLQEESLKKLSKQHEKTPEDIRNHLQLLLAFEPYLYSERARTMLLTLLPDDYLPFPRTAHPVDLIHGFSFEDLSPELSSLSYWNNRQEYVLNADFISFGIFAKSEFCSILSIGLHSSQKTLPPFQLYSSADNAHWEPSDTGCFLSSPRFVQCGPFYKKTPYIKLHHRGRKNAGDLKSSPFHIRLFQVDEGLCKKH